MQRFFIDVTQSSRSSNNSGIQVVTRNLYKQLNSHYNVVPMIWDNILKRYAYLNTTEFRNLENPFFGKYIPKNRPNKQENPVHKQFLFTLIRTLRCINLKVHPLDGDLIIFPEVFRDKRVFHLPKLLNPMLRKTGIFYDANVLRNPEKTPSLRYVNFKNYLDFLSTIHAISCISEESKTAFEKYTIQLNSNTRKKVHHLPVEKPNIINTLTVNSPPLILCVSTLGYNKNHITFLQSAEILWLQGIKFKIELVGQADPSWTPKILRLIEELIKKNRPIKWLQHVNQSTLEERYAKSYFTVYPSLYEGFGLPIIESLIRGKPCICGRNGALGEASKGGGCLTISNQKDSNQLANAMYQLLSEPSLIKRLSLETKKRDFGTWSKYSTDLINHFLN